MSQLSLSQRRQRGKQGEEALQNWLDRARLPYLYVEQSPLTVPKELHGKIKRPDFLVGIPSIGMVAIDAKAKSIYADHIIIDAYERRTFANFETFFNLTVWYACFPPDEPNVCHLFRNRDLLDIAARGKYDPAVYVPLTRTHLADPRRDFMAALLGAISLR